MEKVLTLSDSTFHRPVDIAACMMYNVNIHPVREVGTIIDYSPLWETMERKGISQYRLLVSGIDNRTLDSLKKNRNITMLTLEKLCRIIGCTPNDIVKFTD